MNESLDVIPYNQFFIPVYEIALKRPIFEWQLFFKYNVDFELLAYFPACKCIKFIVSWNYRFPVVFWVYK
jgi:hypothetical protein